MASEGIWVAVLGVAGEDIWLAVLALAGEDIWQRWAQALSGGWGYSASEADACGVSTATAERSCYAGRIRLRCWMQRFEWKVGSLGM